MAAQNKNTEESTSNTANEIKLNVDFSNVKNSRSSDEYIAEYNYNTVDLSVVKSGYYHLTNEGKVNIMVYEVGDKDTNSFPNYKIKLNKLYAMTGFSKKVIDIYFGPYGLNVSDCVFLFLMEDGTIEYLPIEEFILNENTKSCGKLKGVENIVKIKNGSVNFRDKVGNAQGGGATTPLAISSSVEIYDIGKILVEDMKINN